MRALSPQAERSIISALDAAVDLVESGSSPDTALIKAAQEHHLQPGHARLLARAFNTGRTTLQLDSSDDAMSKAAECELADPEAVAKAVEGQAKVASVTVVQAAIGVSDEYSRPPTEIIQQRKLAKMAHVAIPTLPSCQAMPKYTDDDFLKASGEAQRLWKKADNCRSILSAMVRDVEQSVSALTDRFAVIGHPSLATMQKVANVRGDKNVAVVAAELLRRRPALGKRAASTAPALTPAELAAYRDLVKVAEDASRLKTAQSMVSKAVASAAIRTGQLYPTMEIDTPAAAQPLANLNGYKTKVAAYTPLAFGGGVAVEKLLSGNDDAVKNYTQALDDPKHNQELHAIRARTTVENLMAGDPVLSGYHPSEVMEAYNNLTASAPRLADQPLPLQAMLRRYLGQGNELAPDDIQSNLMGLDKSLTPAEPKMRHEGGMIDWSGPANKSQIADAALGEYRTAAKERRSQLFS